jgi:hypothetical protein
MPDIDLHIRGARAEATPEALEAFFSETFLSRPHGPNGNTYRNLRRFSVKGCEVIPDPVGSERRLS